MSAQFRSGTLSSFIQGENMIGTRTNGVYTAKNTLITTDDISSPDIYIKAKEVEVIPGEHALFRGATVYVGKIPVFYFPYYKRSFKRHPWNVHMSGGYDSEWGAYLLSSIRWPGTERFGGEFDLDYRADRGFGMGPRI